ncbi:MAG: hypothetical protein LBG60_10705 [Bifidobacteriaceae bacterium]|jgi:hypothetical protein|nr:hypothetical protein [Bifidobacteriaceae bacterium]
MLPQPEPKLVPGLLAMVAPERLRKFRRAAPAGAHRAALSMYLVDAELTSYFHALLRIVEVLLREAIHRAMRDAFGTPRWFAVPNVRALLDPRTVTALDDAQRGANPSVRGTPAAGSVVAGMMFGTWVNLLDTGARGNYEADLWRPVISGVFQADQPTAPHPRAQVHALAKRMNWARNRVNHCEPVIFGFPRKGQITAQGLRLRTTPHQLLDDARTLCGFISPETAAWLAGWHQFEDVLATQQVAEALRYIDRQPGIALQGRRRQ